MIRRPPRSTRTEHSFPTRRSSDLCTFWTALDGEVQRRAGIALRDIEIDIPEGDRSEEHTSELQSLMRISYAVFCLKKKKKKKQSIPITTHKQHTHTP